MEEPRGARALLRKYFLAPTGYIPIIVGIVLLVVLNAAGADLQWNWLVLYGATMIPLSPIVHNAQSFFRGGLDDNSKSNSSILLLGASAFVVWIFAKSILNASTLGASFGIVGGVAYAGYYLSFFSASAVIYILRVKKGYKSLPEAINARYGTLAAVAFGLAVLYRLYQEIWSNSVVVAGFYGSPQSTSWWLAAIFCTLVPLIYCLTGGMRASLVTDAVQAALAVIFLVATLAVILPKADRSLVTWNPAGKCNLSGAPPSINTAQACALAGTFNGTVSKTYSQATFTPAACNYTALSTPAECALVRGTFKQPSCTLKKEPACELGGGTWHPRKMWSLAGGVDLLIVAILQGLLSYPFFDPVLTDRCFLAEPRAMVKAFTGGGLLAGLFIILFSFIGIFANQKATLDPGSVPADLFKGMLGGQPAAVTRFLGTAIFSIVNIIFITESISTVDSTFTSLAKLIGPEFMGVVEKGSPGTPVDATKRQMNVGRVAMVLLAIAGTLQLMADPTVLDATTVSGTVVMGLGPPVFALMFIDGYRPLMFHLPFWSGVAFGTVFQLSSASCCRDTINTKHFTWGEGSYGKLLGFNVIGSIVAWALCAICYFENMPASNLALEAKEDYSTLGQAKAWVRRLRFPSWGKRMDDVVNDDGTTYKEVL